MHKSQKASGGNAVFYKPVGIVKEIRTGYMYKSPPSRLLKTEKSWKRRFFVLFKINEREHQLKYFRNAEDREKPQGVIDLSQISQLFVSPQNHSKWGWVQKSFKCSPSCVLYVKAAEREYFLVGENSGEVEDWFSDLYDALEHRPHKVLSLEEVYNGNFEVVSDPVQKKQLSVPKAVAPGVKQRSMSEPPPYVRPHSFSEIQKGVEHARRPISEPNPIYDYPSSYLRRLQISENHGKNEAPGNNDSSYYMDMGTVYETVMEPEQHPEQPARALDGEFEEVPGGSLMKSVTQVFDKLKIQISPLPTFDEETTTEDREDLMEGDSKEHLTDFSGSSSDNEPVETLNGQKLHTLEKQNSVESIDDMVPEERDIEVNRADLKKHLTLTDVDGKPCVSGWTGPPHTACLFHKTDQILALNDLHTISVEEFHLYLSKLLKNQVKLTILRIPGSQPLHSTNCVCSGNRPSGILNRPSEILNQPSEILNQPAEILNQPADILEEKAMLK